MMTISDFLRDVSLYEALIGKWTQVGSDVIAHVELAGYNQPAYDRKTDAEVKPVVMVFKSAMPMDDETRRFSIPANGDARVIAQDPIVENRRAVGIELTCEVERYPAKGTPGGTDYATVRLRFAAVDIADAPPI